MKHERNKRLSDSYLQTPWNLQGKSVLVRYVRPVIVVFETQNTSGKTTSESQFRTTLQEGAETFSQTIMCQHR